jgi:hypothetical protein
MATRPIERFQRQTRLQAQEPDFSKARTSAMLTQALSRFSQQAGTFAGQIAADEGARQGQIEGASTEAPGRAPGFTAYGRAYNDAAQRAHVAAVDSDIRTNLERIALEEDANTSRFDARVQGYRKGLLGALSPELRAPVEQEIALQAQRYRARVQGAEQKLMLNESMGALVDATGGIQRDALAAARDGDVDIVEHQRAKFLDLIESAAQTPENPDGILAPAKVAEMRQAFEIQLDAELVVGDFERILREDGIDSALEAMDAFEAGKIQEFQRFEPGHRDQLLGRMNSLLSREMTRQNREQSAADAAERARLAEIKRRADASIRVLEAGFEPEGLEQLVKDAAGTEHESEVLLAAALAGQANRFALADPRSQEAAINALENDMRGRAVDPAEISLLTTMQKIHRNARQALEDDALSYGQQQGLIPALDPLDLSSAEGLAESLATRAGEADKLQAHYGRPVPAMTRQEAALLTDALASGTAGERLSLLQAVTQGLGARAPSTLEVLHKDGHDTLAFVGGMVHEGNTAARDVLAGLDALAADPKLAPTDLESRPELVTVRAAYPPGTQGAVVQAITAHYARASAIAQDSSALFNKDRWEKSVKAVTGGIIEYRAGGFFDTKVKSYFPAPAPGVDAGMFKDWMNGLEPTQIEAMGGVAGMTPEFALEAIRERGRLLPIGRGRWLVSLSSPADGSMRFLHAENPADPAAPEFVLEFE